MLPLLRTTEIPYPSVRCGAGGQPFGAHRLRHLRIEPTEISSDLCAYFAIRTNRTTVTGRFQRNNQKASQYYSRQNPRSSATPAAPHLPSEPPVLTMNTRQGKVDFGRGVVQWDTYVQQAARTKSCDAHSNKLTITSSLISSLIPSNQKVVDHAFAKGKSTPLIPKLLDNSSLLPRLFS